jgi:hypothetical protein
MSQSSEQNQSATNDTEPDDDPAELGSIPDGNSVRDSHDDPRGLNVNDDQLETTSGGVSVDSPVQDNDSHPKVLRSGIHYFSTSFVLKDSGSQASAVSVSRVAMPFVFINRMLREKKRKYIFHRSDSTGR